MALPIFNPAELAQALSGRWIGPVPEKISGVYTDTRHPISGALFVALSGENFDAHNFLELATSQGAGALVIRQEAAARVPDGVPALLVADTLEAWRQLGGLWRKQFPQLQMIGITGSVGKTSVKEMIRSICSAATAPDAVVWTQGNTNNQIGVTQNLLRLNSQTRYAVIEMGSNHFGEIAPLTAIVAPQVALINSIAPCHLEFFGDLEGVAREKSTIFTGVGSGGQAVLPQCSAGNAILREQAHRQNLTITTFGSAESGADYRSSYEKGDIHGSTFKLYFPSGNVSEVHWHLTGAHQALNAAAAAAVAGCCGISEADIVRGLAQTELPGQRQKVTAVNGVTYFNDAYNASPQSMKAGLLMLQEFADPRKLVLLLGEMRELGEHTPQAHAEVAALAQKLFPEARIIFIGSAFAHSVPDAETARQQLTEIVQPGDLVYAKGSFGVGVFRALPPEAR